MTGNNVLWLNQANINEAVQFWLDEVVFTEGARRKVVQVEGPNLNNAPYGERDMFRINLGEAIGGQVEEPEIEVPAPITMKR